MKKFISIMLAAAVALTAFALCACSDSKQDKTFKVGICQYYDSEIYTEATNGFTDKLKEKYGDNVEITLKKAKGDADKCDAILDGFVKDKVDLILANGEPTLKAAADKIEKIPVMATCVHDFASTLKLGNKSGVTGRNISGTSSAVPADAQASMIKELFPNVSTVAILFSSKNSDSKSQSDALTEALQENGYAVTAYTFANDADIADVAAAACSENDILFLPSDNSLIKSSEQLAGVLLKSRTPAITADEKLCAECGLATLSVSYYDLGVTTADMAYRVLTDGEDISQMKVESASEFTKKYNKEMASSMGFDPPEDYTAIGE